MSCDGCIKGSIHAGQPQGTQETVHGLNTYIIGNRVSPRGILVVYPDIFGLPLPNNRLIADAYARSGKWLVYLVDIFEGDPVPLKTADVLLPVDASKQSMLAKYGGLLAAAPQFALWLTRHGKAKTDKVSMDFLRALRQANPNTKIGIIGFCWGGRYALRAGLRGNVVETDGHGTRPLVDAVVAFHPSNLVLPIDVETLVAPTSIGWGKYDNEVNFKQKSQVEELHTRRRTMEGAIPDIEHRVYEPGRHGFAVRGNPDDPLERNCLKESEQQALEWCDRWL